VVNGKREKSKFDMAYQKCGYKALGSLAADEVKKYNINELNCLEEGSEY
jgi:hypothetical protein